MIGDLSKAGLFGQQLWAPGQRLVITEGELDCMSYAQVTGLTWQVVSIPNGCQGAVKAIRRELQFVESFEEVVFLFDQDEHGKKAAEECAALLRPGLAKIAQLPMKDASEMLMSGKEAELKAAVYAAVTVSSVGRRSTLRRSSKPRQKGTTFRTVRLTQHYVVSVEGS